MRTEQGPSFDRRTFDHLVVDHLLALQRLAIRLTGDVHVAEELTQETLLRVSKSWLGAGGSWDG